MSRLDLFPNGKLNITLQRLCAELSEHFGDFSDTVVIASQPRGVFLGRRIYAMLVDMLGEQVPPYGELDVTFFRDDFRRQGKPLEPNKTKVDFLIEDKRVILIDDVLYTGRTIRAALDAMLPYGRPKSVDLLVLVDRKHRRELPIEASFYGIQVDSIPTERVIVDLQEKSGLQDEVFIQDKEN